MNTFTRQNPPKLYTELAEWWPLLSDPVDYAEEAGRYRELLKMHCARQLKTVLELGSGGGNNASHLKAHFELTLVEPSLEMLEVSKRLNPECEHIADDMRSVRLSRPGGIDAVFIHDAIMYMASEQDLQQAIETAFFHCAAGGAALFVPDYIRETFRPSTSHGGHDGDDGRGLRYLEWTWDPNPDDETFIVDFAFLLREPSGEVRCVQDRHTEGLFARKTWLRLMHSVGFEAKAIPVTLSDAEIEAFVGIKPVPLWQKDD